jgi:DNA modification methylase
MEREKMDIPLYLATSKEGECRVPIIFGADAGSRDAAETYGIDANNLVMSGGDFTALDTAKLWKPGDYQIKLTDLAIRGFSPVTVTGDDLDLLNEIAAGQSPEKPPASPPSPELADELMVEFGVQPGQVWALGQHRIMCGNSTDPIQVVHLCNGTKAQLVHADPPYGMGKDILNDNLYRDKLDAFQMRWWFAVRPCLEDNGSVYIWGNAENLFRLWYCGGLKDCERLTFRNEIVWDKPPSGMGDGQNNPVMRSYGIKHETCLFFMLGEQRISENADNYWEGWEPIRLYLYNERIKMGWDIPTMKKIVGHSDLSGDHWTGKYQWSFPTREVYESFQQAANGQAFQQDYDLLKQDYDLLKQDFYATRAYFDNTHENMTDVWQFPRVEGEERWGHLSPKPVEMIERIVKTSSQIGKAVLVPFLGSGSGLIAAERTGRICYGLDLEPRWVAVTLQRWKEETGQTPAEVAS